MRNVNTKRAKEIKDKTDKKGRRYI